MELVFIVGIARTGSKIYMSSLNDHTDIDIVNELHFLAPRYVRGDVVRSLNLHSTPLTGSSRVQAAVDRMYSGTLNGTFWEIRNSSTRLQQRITDIDRDTLIELLSSGAGRPEDLFRTLLFEHARVANKRRAGAKFPVDISCVTKLVDWFPDATFLHLVRDPRAVYASMVKREIEHSRDNLRSKLVSRTRRLAYLVLQFKRAARLHRDLQSSDRYMMSRFEDVASSPEGRLRSICSFLDVEYKAEMLNIRKVDSSYASSKAIGIDASAIDQWKAHLSNVERQVIQRSLKAEMRLFGYL